MLYLHVIQADQGDCLLLEYEGLEGLKFILVDGGPANTYKNHLCQALKERVFGKGILDLVVVSHIDNDHICGVINLLKFLDQEKKQGLLPYVHIRSIWHNSFNQNTGVGNEFITRVLDLVEAASDNNLLSPTLHETVRGFKQGDQTLNLANDLSILINEGCRDKLVTQENVPQPLVMGDLNIWVLGPDHHSLERLQADWYEWLEKNNTREVQRGVDTHIPNLSSIMLLVEEKNGRQILLPGDGTGRDILAGLAKLGKLDAATGKIHVDILKLPHHGSIHNVSEEFFEKVTADVYVISARNDNPDFETLDWIMKSAKSQRRKIQFISTNLTGSTWELQQKYHPQTDDFSFTYLRADQHFATI